MAFRGQLSTSLYKHLCRSLSCSANATAISPCLVRQLPPPTLCLPPIGASFAPCGTLNLCVRGVHTAAAGFLCRDINLDDENPFYEKYRDKLGKIQGLNKQQTRAKIKAARLQEKSRETAFRPPTWPTPLTQYSLLQPPSLDSVMHIDLIAEKTASEISMIWREYHKNEDAVCAIIPTDTYEELLAKAIHCPYFVYPLPRDEGYELMFGQFSGHRCHFTSLINYQQYQENAPVCLTLSHYTDLQRSKGIVLMAGELDISQLSTLEAQYLANQVQLYYSSQDPDRYALLRQFNHEPESFDHHKLIEQLSNSNINVPSYSSAAKGDH